MDKIQALNAFWNSFGIPAFDSSAVPDKTAFPYITYDLTISDFGEPVQQVASIWYKSTSWGAPTQKLEEISQRIGRGGVMIAYDGGAIWLTKGANFAQRMTDENDTVRRYVLQVGLEYME